MMLMASRDQEPLSQSNGMGALSAKEYFQGLSELIPRLPYTAMDGIARTILQAFEEERTIFVFGNGGSAAAASHMMCDMNKGTLTAAQSKRLKVMALTDNVPLLTAWANDSSYDEVFSEQLKNFVGLRDVAFAISASGNSPNVLRALRTARESGAIAVGITGYQGGKMKPLCDICAVVPSNNMQMIEDMHHAILHAMCTVVGKRLRAAAPQAMAAAGGQFNT
jgi:D-sedoheptulose 7-phosphate isomerase